MPQQQQGNDGSGGGARDRKKNEAKNVMPVEQSLSATTTTSDNDKVPTAASGNATTTTTSKSSDGDDDASTTTSTSSNSSSSRSDNKEDDEEPPPPPVSSDDDDEEHVPQFHSTAAAAARSKSTTTAGAGIATGGSSRFFAPYRTVGVVSSGRPFHLVPHEHSGTSLLCVPIGDRFQCLQTDRLQPVLVSQTVPSFAAQQQQEISHCVSDATLSITVVAHGPALHHDNAGSKEQQQQAITLYNRTRAVASQAVVIVPPPPPRRRNNSGQRRRRQQQASSSCCWCIQDLLHMGRVKVPQTGEKRGLLENAAVIVVILRKQQELNDDDDDDDEDAKVPIVGQDDSDQEDSDDSDDDDDDAHMRGSDPDAFNEKDEEMKDPDCLGQVVVYLATRTSLVLQKRVYLETQPTFEPICAVHPATYLNKIVLGGKDENDNKKKLAMLLVNIRSGKVVHRFQCLKRSSTQTTTTTTAEVITALEQSPAVDTIAVGTNRGLVQLINLRHDKRLFSLRHESSLKNSVVEITSLSFRTDAAALQFGIAPMAVGRSDGKITVWDLTPPSQDDDDDNNNGISNTPLPRRRQVLCEMTRVHPGGIAKLQYMPQEPLLVSIGQRSNAVTMHIFDNPDYSARLLRSRRGHAAPPRLIRYLHNSGGGVLVQAADGADATACQILSTGGPDRTLRVFSTAKSIHDKEYSQGAGLQKKAKKLNLGSTVELLLPPTTDLARAESRRRDWGDLVTIHQDHAMAYVWSTQRGAQSGPVLRQSEWNVSAMKRPPPRTAHATSVAVSPCGNFAVVGTRGGTIYKYNMQSGLPRGSYPRLQDQQEDDGPKRRAMAGDINRTLKALEREMKVSKRAADLDKRELDDEQQNKLVQQRNAKLKVASHAGYGVTGIAVDAINKTLVSVGEDAKLILWNFVTHAPHKKSPFRLPCAATKLRYARDSDLTALALEDYSVVLFDCTSHAIVRRFGTSGSASRHSGPITDLCFSPDGRSLYTSSLDSTIRMWDLPTNLCMDWLGFSSPPTSMTVSPTGEFLATSHTNKLGLSLWSDKSFFQTVHTDGKLLAAPAAMDDPAPLGESSSENEASTTTTTEIVVKPKAENQNDHASSQDAPSVVPKQPGLVTLSGLAPSHWKNLFHLEVIKERNKPLEPPKRPPSAPFFLQWRSAEPIADEPAGEQPTAGDGAPPDKDAKTNEEEEWAAAWSDEDDDDRDEQTDVELPSRSSVDQEKSPSAGSAEGSSTKKRDAQAAETEDTIKDGSLFSKKRKKVTHARSHLASLLHQCARTHHPKPQRSNENSACLMMDEPRQFQAVTDHIATLGPSAIDVALSTLCSGVHDLEEGLPLLQLACRWLLEACRSCERYEAINAYLHRFLHIHAAVIGVIDETYKKSSPSDDQQDANQGDESFRQQKIELMGLVAELREAQRLGGDALRGKMQNTLCLLRHFSRMV